MNFNQLTAQLVASITPDETAEMTAKQPKFATIEEFPQLNEFQLPLKLLIKFIAAKVCRSQLAQVGDIVVDKYGYGGNLVKIYNRVYAGNSYSFGNRCTGNIIRLTVEQAQEVVNG
jgi:hypothetical protein